MRLARLVAALSLPATRPVTASATDVGDCQALLAQHMRVDLALSLDQFDQDDHQGWRPLSDAGCETEAATLIASYAAQHPHPVLTWHRAQMLAKAGKAAEAIEAARLTLRPPHSDDGSGFDWNDYANATIAFLQGDKPSLQSNRDRLADAAAKAEVNQPNLRSVDKLLRCFGQPYKMGLLMSDCAVKSGGGHKQAQAIDRFRVAYLRHRIRCQLAWGNDLFYRAILTALRWCPIVPEPRCPKPQLKVMVHRYAENR